MKWIIESNSRGKTTLPNHTVSLYYTLSAKVASLSESSPEGKVLSQDKSSLTLVHVPGEAGQDATQRRRIEEPHRAEKEPAEQLVMESRSGLHGALSAQTRSHV